MSSITKRFASSSLEKSLYDAFVKESRSLNKSVKLYNPNGLQQQPQQQHIRSITDKWVNDALNTKGKPDNTGVVTLQYPVILKTLQQLRSNNNTGLYFRLLKRLTSAKIGWVNTNFETTAADRQVDGVPIEFYRELANMLYRISLGLKYHRNQAEINALATFTLQVMQQYAKVRVKKEKKMNVKFWQRTIPVLLKTKSVVFRDEILNLLSSIEPENGDSYTVKMLTDYTNIAFYSDTEQILNFEDCISQLSGCPPTDKLKESFTELFQPLFSRILQRYLLCDMIEEYDALLKRIHSEYTMTLDEHDISILDHICKRRALPLASETVGQFRLDNGWEASSLRRSLTTNQLTFIELLKELIKNKIDPYDTKFANTLDFAIFKVEGNNEYRLEYWKEELPRIAAEMETADAPDAIKIFFINTILQHFVGSHYMAYTLMLLTGMYSHQTLAVPLSKCEMTATPHSTGYHPLFQMMEYNSSSVLTSLELFYHLLNLNTEGKYNFVPQDFNSLLKMSTRLRDDTLFKVYFLHFVNNMGHTFYNCTSGKWTLPKLMSWLLDDSSPYKISVDDINHIEMIFINSQGKAMTQGGYTKLESIFGEKYTNLMGKSPLSGKESIDRTMMQVLKNSFANPKEYSLREDRRGREKLKVFLQSCE